MMRAQTGAKGLPQEETKLMEFSKTAVTVTLTGSQWFALIAKGANKTLSKEGEAIYFQAAQSLGRQVVAASNRHAPDPL